MTFKKNKLALGMATATLTLAVAMIAPQAVAGTKAEIGNLQNQVNEMASMMRSMQAEIARLKSQGSVDNSAKVQELESWMADIKSKPAGAKDNIFAVRGGWMHMNNARGNNTAGLGTGFSNDLLTSPVNSDAFYYGGAVTFNMNNNLFGLMEGTSFGIEFGIEYSELGTRKRSGLNPALTAISGGVIPANIQQTVTVNMLRVSAAPKITFMHGSKFRPWLIPMGLDFNIISPPSDAVTVLNTGMQFGVGADYELLPNILLGADARYHWSPDNIDGVDTDGFTLGGSIGFKW